ncbi:hypothetical protein DITRI_Ditri13aG0119900 [Diplodiscus trichospermus]
MEHSYPCKSWRPPYPVHHHHHQPPIILCPHHHHHTVLCPLHHHHHLVTCHCHVSPTMAPLPLENHLNSVSTTVQNEAHHSDTLVLQEQEYEREEQGEEEVMEEEEEEEEPIFVLTDEWKEFFAKSEAKRKLEKKQAKKNKN